MSLVAAIIFGTSAAASPVAATSGPDNITVRASARIIAGTPIRQESGETPKGPHVQVSRDKNGQVWIEFT